MTKTKKKLRLTIGILTYNHEKYIEECLDSVISQRGDFDLRIIILNDKSSDKTDAVISKYIKKNSSHSIEYAVNNVNLGAQQSIYKIIGLIKETRPDFWSYIEGDDKYLSQDRTQKHLDLLRSNPSAIVSYNKLLLIDQNSKVLSKHEPENTQKTLSTNELAAQNHIGSFCATFYSAKCFNFFNPEEFEGLTVYDWFFNIWMSRFGEVRLLNEYLSGYRQHPTSVWSSMSQTAQYWELIGSIDSYNRKLGFMYDKAFQSYKRNIINQLAVIGNPMTVDIAVLSEQFTAGKDFYVPTEVQYILNNNDNAIVLSTAKKGTLLQKKIEKIKQRAPLLGSKILGYDGNYSVSARTIYATSIDDAYYSALPITNYQDTYLIFEIGMGEEGTMNTFESKTKLKAIFKSINFVKVIVHSEHAKQMLINKKLCSQDRIALIPSSVSRKIYGDNNIFRDRQLISYFLQTDNLLKRCISRELRPAPVHPFRKVKRCLRVLGKRGKDRAIVVVRKVPGVVLIVRKAKHTSGLNKGSKEVG